MDAAQRPTSRLSKPKHRHQQKLAPTSTSHTESKEKPNYTSVPVIDLNKSTELPKRNSKLDSFHSARSRKQVSNILSNNKVYLCNKRHENCFNPMVPLPCSPKEGQKMQPSSFISQAPPYKSTKCPSPSRGRSSRSKSASSEPKKTSKTSLVHQNNPCESKKCTVMIKNLKSPENPPIKSDVKAKDLPKRQSSLKIQAKKGHEEITLQSLKEMAERAIKERKTFTVCGNYSSVRKSLLARGWVEKIHYSHTNPDRETLRRLSSLPLAELILFVNDKNNGALYKRVILSKFLSHHQVDLFWDYSGEAHKVNSDDVKFTIINNIRRSVYSYSTKQGLCELMKRAHWYHNPGISSIRHPRSYSLTETGDPEDFINDFRVTAAMSLLKWIIHTNENSVAKLISDSGKIPITTFHFALQECEKFIQRCKHNDIDQIIKEALDFEWNQFLDFYYRCVHIGNHFKTSSDETEQSLVHKSKIMLAKLQKIWPYLQMDGFMDIWILKPTIGSRGIGIHICRTLQYVMKIVKENRTHKYIIQKYIERPLLIYNTKFDIRQWFLISCTSPLTIWIYKDCYLRFSSQTYNLRKLHESIHLTNNSVQCKYKNNNRDPTLPEFNMWDLNRFKNYLEMIGYPKTFDEIIFPGMKECITAAILINQDYIHPRKNSFELYGADFMLTEDFKPWLIEINSRPALHASTPVTTKMCPRVLEDVIKVVVDFARNSKCSTGGFQPLYKERSLPLPAVDLADLKIRGYPLPSKYFYTPPNEFVQIQVQPEHVSSDIININNTQTYMKYVSKQMKKTLENLLEIIHRERERRNLMKTKRRDNYLSMKIAKESKIPLNLQKDSIQYLDNITQVNEDIKEIQEILTPNHVSDKGLKEFADAVAECNRCDLLPSQDEAPKHNVKVENEEKENSELIETKEFKVKSEEVVQYVKKEELYLTENELAKIVEELPRKSDSELKMETEKIEEVIRKITKGTDKKNRSSIFGDFFSFVNVFHKKHKGK